MNEPHPVERYAAGDLVIDAVSGSVTRGGVALSLPPRTFELLLALARRHPQHVRRQELLDAVWPDEIVTDQALSHRVLLLRRALGDDCAHPRYVASDRGWGYRLLVPVERLPEAPSISSPTRGGPTRPARIGAAVATLAGLGLAALLLSGRGRWMGGQAAGPALVEVAAFPAPEGDPSASLLARRLNDRIVSALREERSLRVVGPGTPAGPGRRARIEGSFAGGKGLLTLSLRVVEPVSGRIRWEQRMAGSVYEIFEAEERLAGGVLVAVRHQLGLPDRSASASTEAAVARLCLQGEWLMRSLQGPSLRQAAEAYRRALALDGASGIAHAGLATTYAKLALLAEMPVPEAAERARKAAEQAERSAPGLPATAAAMGLVHFVFDWDLDAAGVDLQRAVESGPDEPVALTAFAWYLQAAGRPEASLPLLRRAEDIDPFAAGAPYLIGRAHHLARRCSAALEAYERAARLDPSLAIAYWGAAECHSDLNQGDAALRALRREQGLIDLDRRALPGLENAYARGRLMGLWASVCARPAARPRDPVSVALSCARGAQAEEAFRWLDRAAAERTPSFLFVAHDPGLDGLRATPGFARLMEENGLPRRRN